MLNDMAAMHTQQDAFMHTRTRGVELRIGRSSRTSSASCKIYHCIYTQTTLRTGAHIVNGMTIWEYIICSIQ